MRRRERVVVENTEAKNGGRYHPFCMHVHCHIRHLLRSIHGGNPCTAAYEGTQALCSANYSCMMDMRALEMVEQFAALVFFFFAILTLLSPLALMLSNVSVFFIFHAC